MQCGQGRGRMARWFAQVLALLVMLHSAQAQTRCPGDCDGSANVAINELIQGVNITLGRSPLSGCAEFDLDDGGTVTVNELIAAVRSSLDGCPIVDTPSPTEEPIAEATVTSVVTPSGTPTATPSVALASGAVELRVFTSDNGTLYYVIGVDVGAGSRGIGAQITSLAMSDGPVQAVAEPFSPPDRVLTAFAGANIGTSVPPARLRRTGIVRGLNSNDIILDNPPNPSNGEFDPAANGGRGLLVLPDGKGTVGVDGSGTETVHPVDMASGTGTAAFVPAAATTSNIRRRILNNTIRAESLVFPNPAGPVLLSAASTCSAGNGVPCDPSVPPAMQDPCGGTECGFSGGEMSGQTVTLDDTIDTRIGNATAQGTQVDGFFLRAGTDLIVFIIENSERPAPLNAAATGFLVVGSCAGGDNDDRPCSSPADCPGSLGCNDAVRARLMVAAVGGSGVRVMPPPPPTATATNTPIPTRTPTMMQCPTVSVSALGSIVVFPALRVDGTSDPILSLTNAGNGIVHAYCFYATRPECSILPFEVTLTRQSSAQWRASAGAGDIPGVPEIPFDGELVCVEVDASDFPVSGNHLVGATRADDDPCATTTTSVSGEPGFDGDESVLCFDGSSAVPGCSSGPEYGACPTAVDASRIDNCWSQSRFVFACGGPSGGEPTHTPTASAPIPSVTRTRTPTPTRTGMSTRTGTPMATPTRSATVTATPTVTVAEPPGQLLETGQTTCYDAGGAVTSCAGTGQDGELQKGLAAAYMDNGDGTITDTNTGLMWEKLSDDGSVHDKDDVYTWADALSIKVAALNSGSGFAGHTDWRLPNVNELQSLSNYEVSRPAVSAVFNTSCVPSCTVNTCSCTRLNFEYWSASSVARSPALAWAVGLGFEGEVVSGNKTGESCVRLVRGGASLVSRGQRLRTGQTQCHSDTGAPIDCAATGQDGERNSGLPRTYVDNGDGTISDTNTGLMWEKLSDDGSVHDKDDVYTWAEALSVKVAALNSGAGFAGHTDWRLPNVNELQSLSNYGVSRPAVNAVFNTSCAPSCTVNTCSCTQSLNYWSVSTLAPFPTGAWQVWFFDGDVYFELKTRVYYVRLVRGGS
jgi:hypothetical protein